jgi:hypothetical protein
MFIAKQPGSGNATPTGSHNLAHDFFYKHAIPLGLENQNSNDKKIKKWL